MLPLERILRQAQDEACLWGGIIGTGKARELAVHPFHVHLILSLSKDEACLWGGIIGTGKARELAVHPFHVHLILSLSKDVSARRANAVGVLFFGASAGGGSSHTHPSTGSG